MSKTLTKEKLVIQLSPGDILDEVLKKKTVARYVVIGRVIDNHPKFEFGGKKYIRVTYDLFLIWCAKMMRQIVIDQEYIGQSTKKIYYLMKMTGKSLLNHPYPERQMMEDISKKRIYDLNPGDIIREIMDNEEVARYMVLTRTIQGLNAQYYYVEYCYILYFSDIIYGLPNKPGELFIIDSINLENDSQWDIVVRSGLSWDESNLEKE